MHPFVWPRPESSNLQPDAAFPEPCNSLNPVPHMNTQQNVADLTGRILISAIFLLSGLSKIGGYAATQGYMAAMGVPGGLLPIVIALEILAPVAIIVGYRTRLAAFLLAGFSIVSALLFHRALGDQTQFIMFMKNFAMAGGFLFLVARGPGEWSLDARRDTLA